MKNNKIWNYISVTGVIVFWLSLIARFIFPQFHLILTPLIIISLIICFIRIKQDDSKDVENFKKSLPKNVRGFLLLKKNITRDSTFKLTKHALGDIWSTRQDVSVDDIPRRGETLLCINNKKYITFLIGGKSSPKYYLATVNFKPNVQVHKWTTTNSHVQGRVGSTLAGAAVGSLVGAPLVGALIGHSRKRKIKSDTRFHERKFEFPSVAYLQLVTTDFKHVKQIKLTNVETRVYKLLSREYMLTSRELKHLESKHNVKN